MLLLEHKKIITEKVILKWKGALSNENSFQILRYKTFYGCK
jgi:hypothetical protein